MPEIREVVSESLQAAVRRLLPSQRGFTEDLQASNVITPVIDLTPTAEGSGLTDYLQTALNYQDVTSHTINGATSTIISNTGFFRIFGIMSLQGAQAGNANAFFQLTGTGANKTLLNFAQNLSGAQAEFLSIPVDFYVFINAGETVTATSGNGGVIQVVTRQIADVYGNLNDPTGFNPQ